MLLSSVKFLAVTTATSPELAADGLRRDVGPIGLLFSSTTSVIGSGWLFAAFTAAAIAGPSSIVSWLIGGAILALVALCYSELSTLLPVAGGIFLIETLSVILQMGSYKLRGKKRLFLMAPIHHHFQLLGWPESKITIRFWIVAIILALLSLSTLKLQ